MATPSHIRALITERAVFSRSMIGGLLPGMHGPRKTPVSEIPITRAREKPKTLLVLTRCCSVLGRSGRLAKVRGESSGGRGAGKVAFEHLTPFGQLPLLLSQLIAHLPDTGDERGAVTLRRIRPGARKDLPDDFRGQARAVESPG